MSELDAAAVGRQIAYRIRAELVCCNIYGRVNDDESLSDQDQDNLIGNLILNKDWHDLCYWGEASARIAETPEQWQDDPTDWDWSTPDRVQRRRERNSGAS